MTWRAIFILSFALLIGGCAPPAPVDLFEQSPTTTAAPAAYDDRDWETVLRDHVRDGAVDYRSLAENPIALQRYLALLAQTGPNSTPAGFAEQPARLAYYLNAYNACVLRAVLAKGLPASMYGAALPPLDTGYRFRVDGAIVTLADLRQRAREESAGNARVELALCDAARGSPPLVRQPFRAYNLARRLDEVAAEALARPTVAAVDHEGRKILVARAIWDQRAVFETLYRRETSSPSSTLLSALLHLADSSARERLARGTGYSLRPLPFDAALNAWAPPEEPARSGFPFLGGGRG